MADSTVRVWDINNASTTTTSTPVLNKFNMHILNSDDNSLSSSSTSSSALSSSSPHYTTLIGHGGPVYSTSYSHDNEYLLSASSDASIRLWHLPSSLPLVSYTGHTFPIWDVCFSPLSFYFASASLDRTARLYSLSHPHPLRIFVGHLSDVQVVRFHPNINYILTGSHDHTVRMWDIQTGMVVELNRMLNNIWMSAWCLQVTAFEWWLVTHHQCRRLPSHLMVVIVFPVAMIIEW